MDFSDSTLWWVLAGALVAAELLTGTFYLLMIALGAAAGALAAHAGATGTAQVVAAALVAGGATAAWHFKRASHPQSAPAASNPDVNLDIGQSVTVQAWGADGTASVQYRGATWQVRHAGAGAPTPGPHRIVAVHGNRLDVAPA
ncbi:MAG: NfeD family protein [Rubrivivax sp.]|jgi:membrane protein implicated in regulation of membrane protease activity